MITLSDYDPFKQHKMVLVSIGKDVPMGDLINDTTKLTLNERAWQAFKFKVQAAILRSFGTALKHWLMWEGTQTWEGEAEESVMYQLMIENTTSEQLVISFCQEVRRICEEYHQEAVFIGRGNGKVIEFNPKD